ncbi:hypothetical protein LCL87_03525 [Rhodococcus hoagii]|nr:hypothetical protein [Prescottella equi]
MGGTDLAASLVDSLVWPIVAVVAILTFRGQIRSILEALRNRMRDLKSFTVPGGGAEFTERMAAAASTGEQVEAATSEAAPPTPSGQLGAMGATQETASPINEWMLGGAWVLGDRDRRKLALRSMAASDPRAAVVGAGANLEVALRAAYERLFPAEGTAYLTLDPEQLAARIAAHYALPDQAETLIPEVIALGRDVSHLANFEVDSKTVDRYLRTTDFVVAHLNTLGVEPFSPESAAAKN